MHTLVIPLEATERDIHIVSGALNIVGRLRNAALGEMLDRIQWMKWDPRWKAAKKIKLQKDKNHAYRELRKEYKVSSQDMVRICHKHWKDSKWMGERIGGRIATALASEIWQNLEEHLFARADRPKFKPSGERDMIWNNDNASGLLLRNNCIEWNIKTKRKSLRIPLDLNSISRPRRRHFEGRLAEGALRRVGIKRIMVRGQWRLFAVIYLEGAPYRSAEYLSEIDTLCKDVVGLDLGPTWLAVVSKDEALELPIATAERLAQEQEMRRKQKNRQRALDRSRAAANPHARRKNDRSVYGVKQPQRTKRGQERQLKAADEQRKDRINRQKDRSNAVRTTMRTGIHIAMEDLNYKAWQKSLFGKRMLITSPGEFVSRLQREAEMLGGSVHLIDAYQARASQTCLCGKHTGKKKLSQRVHECPYCSLVADRDMVSAALVRELTLADEQVWDEGLAEMRLREGVPPEWSRIEQASRTKHAAVEAILSSCRTPSSLKAGAGNPGSSSCVLAATSSNQSTESSISTVLLCEKPTSDPEVKTYPNSHVPTCEESAVQRLGASRKAAVKKSNASPPPMHSG